ncbi:hypothetical protein B0H66DRAFT_611244 [Apodospora peruviana]|uniref:Nitrate reductase [NADPH] n=1 Tax=Apodospora peruviana TaxID=516989 RepID=A0AAE0IRW1_9PEZI|nr:hypothetical protein B0H66DRAFT_611244 [Apodospora peruviana]
MPHHIPWEVHVKSHPGSSVKDIENEPDWSKRRAHRIGYKDHDGRRPGITHTDYEEHEIPEDIKEAVRRRDELRRKIDTGHLVNFRDVIEHQTSFHLRYPENRSLGWRYVLETTEDWVKNGQPWPANVEKKEAQMKEGAEDDPTEFSPQEHALLKRIQEEARYISQLKQNNGKQKCPQTRNRSSISIDEQDQFTPDNWLPRCPDLIRLTGKHPMNAEPPLTELLNGGLITPNELHYVRNHGAVPRLLWELHRLDIEGGGANDGKLSLSMDQLKNRYTDSIINIPVAMACTGNRRKELNLMRKTKGANNGAASVGCAYWKGPLLRDVLISAGINIPSDGKRHWINFAGADSPSEGPYETSIPLEYAMDPSNDVVLAMYMNDLPLPPDHGYPVRLIIPGYIGGRCVKWLRRIWVTDCENESYYHIWDNRIMPSFVTSKDSEFANVLFHHPSTACSEQNMNSVVAKPAEGERIPLREATPGKMYRVQGYALSGGGREVQQVEVSIDRGKTWLLAVRELPEFPIRHGDKFWAWLFWHVDVDLADLVRSPEITVRCLDAAKNTQPEKFNWNLMGMMNNSWYTVKPEIMEENDKSLSSTATIVFRHPTQPATLPGGWVQPSEQVKTAEARQDDVGPAGGKQFTREEIEKHDKEKDCWIVVDSKVYDATSVLDWHPGGKTAILTHAGRCHQETTDEFASIHDDFAYKKLQECLLGQVTDKTADFIKQSGNAASATAGSGAKVQHQDDAVALERHRWTPVKLISRHPVSADTRTYTFALPEGKPSLGLGTCQHVQLGFHLQDRMLVRPYTPTRPILPGGVVSGPGPISAITTTTTKSKQKRKQHRKKPSHDNDNSASALQPADQPALPPPLHDKHDGTFDLTIKTYLPSLSSAGGALSNLLDCMPLGEEVEVRGPTGDIVYHGNGNFSISSRTLHFDRVSLVLGGSGITPGYALMARSLLTPGDCTQIRVVDANRSQGDILLKKDLDLFQTVSGGRIKIMHVLSRPDKKWEGVTGYVDRDKLRRGLFPPSSPPENRDGSDAGAGGRAVVFLCGPPGLVQGVALPVLKGMRSPSLL